MVKRSEQSAFGMVNPTMKLLRTSLLLGSMALVMASVAATPAVPKYKPSARSPQPLDITSNAYGFSRSAPDALALGATVPDFIAPSPSGGTVSLAAARQRGPVAIIFYRGHW